jgi:hypothetical protein
MESINLQKLISEISPLYNLYKQSNRNIVGTDALQIMWDIGDLLKKEIEISNIAPHNLYRKIYGKAEGQDNITQKSYITREFLGRAYRIRNIFEKKEDIKKILPNLKNFISFREAMPFFDNEKYILKGQEREKILSILNSDESSNLILKKIKLLQAEKIGKKNPRNQKLNELEKEKGVFITFYNYLYNLIKKSDYNSVKKAISPIDDFTLVCLSSATSCLAQEGLKYPEISEENFDQMWNEYISMIRRFSTQKDPKERRRFRRLIPLSRIVKLAEMLQAVTSNESYLNFKK